MEVTDGAVTSVNDDYSVEQTLFTYSEEEKQENALNKMNADLIWKPEFFTVDYAMLHSGFSMLETALYGFIKFFLRNNERFYCSTEKLAEMFCVSESTIKNTIKTLKAKRLIDVTGKPMAKGGRIRFIKLVEGGISEGQNLPFAEGQNLPCIKNNIYKENNICSNGNKTTTSSKKKTELTPEQTEAFEKVWKEYPQKTHKKDAKKHFLEHDYDELMFDAKQKKWIVELEVTEKQFIRGGGRWMEEFSPQSENQKMQDMRKIFERHMELGGEGMRERMEQLKADFPEVDFKKLASEYNEKNKIKFNFIP